MIVDLINKATGSELESNFFFKLGQETLRLEAQFNKDAGFQVEDDDLPQFFTMSLSLHLNKLRDSKRKR